MQVHIDNAHAQRCVSNGEYFAELVRAHYQRDDERFDTILRQIITSERLHHRHALANRLEDSMWAVTGKLREVDDAGQTG